VSLFAELKRRNVFRVGAAYVVIGWLLLQAADILLGNFGAPDWVFKSFVALLALGLPLALFLSWAYELTPEGMKRTEAVDAGESLTPKTGKRIDRLIVIGLLAVIALLVVERVWFAGAPSDPVESMTVDTAEAVPSPARSIAVLAFEDLSPERDQAYFAEGVAEELLNLLARIDGLKVAARTSSFRFKGSGADIAEIGRALNVETVLEGSVRKAGDQVRVTAQLINVGDGFHLWSDSYDRRLENIFAVQDQIATAIVAALRLELDIPAATAGRTGNTGAYDHYLRGRQLAREPSRAGLLRAIEQYERAIGLDPDFAAAYAGIADAWVWLEDYGGVPGAEAFPRAEQAAKRALDLDPESAEAHAAMAFVRHRYHEDMLGAIQAFERTLELNPNHVAAYNLYSDVLFDVGHLDRMLEVARRAAELDPLSPFLQARYAGRMMNVGRFAETRAHLERGLRQFPGNDYLIETLADLEGSEARFADALRHYRAVHVSRPGDPYSAARIAQIAVRLGEPQMARAWIAAARERGPDNRWELIARSDLELAADDWLELSRVGDLRGGRHGAEARGIAAARQGELPTARQHLLEALRLSGYDPAGPALRSHTPLLIELARVERDFGLDGWREHLRAARSTLDALLAGGSTSPDFNALNERVQLARIEALEGNRSAAFESLRRAVSGSYREPWLARDPFFAEWRDEPEFQALLTDIEARLAVERERIATKERLP
jgi:TolB-like protein/Tfp pilus assembly protein PilF